jgi:hypothetical protein
VIEGGGRDEVPILRAVRYIEASEADVCRVERNRVGRPDNARQAATEFVLQHLSDEPKRWRMSYVQPTALSPLPKVRSTACALSWRKAVRSSRLEGDARQDGS